MKVLFFVRRIGPYHHARFERAAGAVELAVVETRSASTEYEWNFNPDGSYKIDRFSAGEHAESGLHGDQLKRAVAKAFDTHPADVVVTTGWADHEYHAVVLEAHRRKIPRIVISDSRYEDEPRVFYKEIIKKQILKSYSAAIVAGTASRNYLVRLGFEEKAIFKPWDVVDNDYFSSGASTVPFDQRPFLCVSRFIPKKNLHQLLVSYKGYRDHGGKRKLVLAGSGELEANLKESLRAMDLNDHVTMPGFLQYDSLRKCYADSFCFILPSTSDQWGLVVNEAMAAGLPVAVSANCGCASDLIVESENGFIFDPFKTDEMTEVLVKMSGLDEVGWKHMSEKSKLLINKWGLSEFARGLSEAAKHATSVVPGGISFLHKLLAK